MLDIFRTKFMIAENVVLSSVLIVLKFCLRYLKEILMSLCGAAILFFSIV
jgi:hypothetical protein